MKMKKLITLLISGSLILTAAAIAQPPAEDQTQTGQTGQTGETKKAKKTQATEQTQSAGGAATEKPGKAERRAAKKAARQDAGAGTNANADATTNAGAEAGAMKSQNANKEGGRKGRHAGKAKADANADANAATNANAASPEASASVGAGATTDVNEKGKGKGKRGRNARNKAESASPATGASAAAGAQTTNATGNETNVNAGANANVAGGGKIRGHGKGGKQLDQNIVQKVKTQHADFKAQPRPDKVPKVTFNQNYRIQGADQWQGAHYNVFRTYHPERHDRSWYTSHYTRVEVIGGGAYYWNSGYWYPAWGYDPGAEYYAYDGPIYVGQQVRPPDQVIADVQAILQEAGYYTGEVDGLLGPLTRQALTDYQADNGLYQTAAIDEPTLDSLGLS